MNRIMPTTYVRSAALVSSFLLAAACESSGLGPEPTESVRIHLEVTGGLAGVDYAFTVDGADASPDATSSPATFCYTSPRTRSGISRRCSWTRA